MRKTVKIVVGGALLLAALFSFMSASSAHAATLSMKPHATPAGATAYAATATTAAHTTVAVTASCPATVGFGYQEHGSAVLLAQQSLNWWYYHNAGFRSWINKWYPNDFPIAEDSYYGPQTYYATCDFQYWYGLTSDGIIGPQTWHALGHC